MKISPKYVVINQPSAFEFFNTFPDEGSAREYLINARWPDGIVCAHCGHDEVWRICKGKLFTCKSCRKQFTVRVGTVMEDSAIPHRKWLFGMYLFGIHPKGIASTSMAKQLGITQKSAWYMDHRLREAFQHSGVVLNGTAEGDETYIGRTAKNKHKKIKLNAGYGTVGKQIVTDMTERNGWAVAFPIPNTSMQVLNGNIHDRISAIYTDELTGYNSISETHRHESVNHSTGEYVRGDVHTNGIESGWALLKRAHYGIYHHWSRKHGHRYAAEISGRYDIENYPAFDDGDDSGFTMIRLMMSGLIGKRLTYRELADG